MYIGVIMLLPIDTQITQSNSFADVLKLVVSSLSATSQRQYKYTYQLWVNFANAHGFSPVELTAKNVIAFLDNQQLSKSTKQARLTHLRQLANSLFAHFPDEPKFKGFHEQLKLVKIKTGNTQNQRNKKSLEPDEIYNLFNKFAGNGASDVRNRALLAVLFYAGLRRFEVVNLKWGDIDFKQGLITVQHGKGDKSRTIPFASSKAIKYLQEWRNFIPDYEYVFVAIRKGNHIQDDKPISDKTLYDVIKVLGFAPHDARRTLLTNALAAGTSVSDAQFIAGHSNPQTTLKYAIVKDANEVKGRLKLNY